MGRTDGVGLPTREAPTTRMERWRRRSPRGHVAAALGGRARRRAWWERTIIASATYANGAAATGLMPHWLDPELARSAALGSRSGRLHMPPRTDPQRFRKRRIYPFGVSRVRLDQVIRELGLPAVVSRDERDADALLVLKSMYRKQPDRVDAAQAAGMPVYVLRSGGLERLRETLSEMFHIERRVPGAPDAAADDLDEDEDEGDDEGDGEQE